MKSGITQNNLNVNTCSRRLSGDMAETYWENLGILAGSQPLERVVCSGGVSWKRQELIRMISRVTGLPCCLSALDGEAVADSTGWLSAAAESAGAGR